MSVIYSFNSLVHRTTSRTRFINKVLFVLPMELGLSNLLVKPFFFKLSKEGKNKIFYDISYSTNELANKLNCSKNTILTIKKEDKLIRYDYLRKLLELSNLNPGEVEKYIIKVRRGDSNTEIKITLPIKESPELAFLVAKAMGDGGISSDIRFFYTNQQKKLVDGVIRNVREAIGVETYVLHFKKNSKCYEMKFPPIVGIVLHHFGVPIGKKVYQEFDIPDWIKSGDLEFKRQFIKALFDDEAFMGNDGKSRRIVFAMAKIKVYENSLVEFLSSTKMLLVCFGVTSTKIRLQEEHEDKLTLAFGVYGKDNLILYKESIDFDHPNKCKKLDCALSGYKDIHATKNLVLEIVKNSNNALNTTEVSLLAKINADLAYFHLNSLLMENKLNKINSSPAIWYSKEITIRGRKEILLEKLKSGSLSTTLISQRSGINYRTTLNCLHLLRNEGLIVSNKDKKNIIWNINSK